MTHPLVEQVARAAEPAVWEWLDHCEAYRKRTGERTQRTAITRAQSLGRGAAILAATLARIREPSEGMVEAVATAPDILTSLPSDESARRNMRKLWPIMIDALAQEVAGDG